MAIDTQLKAWGFETVVYAQHVAPEQPVRGIPDAHLIPFLKTKMTCSFFTTQFTRPMYGCFRHFSGRKMLVYHNITPAKFFVGWDNHRTALCEMGRSVLKTMVNCDLAVGDSDFNRQELVEAGFHPANKPSSCSQLARTEKGTAVTPHHTLKKKPFGWRWGA
ncbi:MAG: hypothetical protein R3D55_27785 [Chloroflexota bacterium]